MTSSLCEIEKLVELFNSSVNRESLADASNDDDLQRDDVQCISNEKTNNKEAVKNKQNPYAKIELPEKKETDSDADELYFEDTSSKTSHKDWKKTPKWDISYRQSVTATDMFLGMGFKTPSTASCENMIITINLPGEKRQNIDLKIEKEILTLTSPNFLLELNLPHPVDPKRGDAQFDKNEEKLIVTLIMCRELDILNF